MNSGESKRKLYRIYNETTGEFFIVSLFTEKAAENLVIHLFTIDESKHWQFKSVTDEMLRYNEIVTSDDYKREIAMFKQIYSGVNLKMRVNRFHKILGIRPLEEMNLFETFKL